MDSKDTEEEKALVRSTVNDTINDKTIEKIAPDQLGR